MPQETNPMEETNGLLESLITSQDDNAKHTQDLLTNLIEINSKEDNSDTLRENSIELQSRMVEKLDKLVEQENQPWDIKLILE